MKTLLQTILNRWLTTANIKLSLPVLVTAFGAIVTYQTMQIKKVREDNVVLRQEIRQVNDNIQLRISTNDLMLFEYGHEILSTWIEKMSNTQKTMVEYLEISEREQRLLNRNIDIGAKEVLEKAEKVQKEYQVAQPDSLMIKWKKLK